MSIRITEGAEAAARVSASPLAVLGFDDAVAEPRQLMGVAPPRRLITLSSTIRTSGPAVPRRWPRPPPPRRARSKPLPRRTGARRRRGPLCPLLKLLQLLEHRLLVNEDFPIHQGRRRAPRGVFSAAAPLPRPSRRPSPAVSPGPTSAASNGREASRRSTWPPAAPPGRRRSPRTSGAPTPAKIADERAAGGARADRPQDAGVRQSAAGTATGSGSPAAGAGGALARRRASTRRRSARPSARRAARQIARPRPVPP